MIRKTKGFTLIECLFALAMISLLALYLIPNINNLIVDSRKIKDSGKIVLALEEALEEKKADIRKADSINYGSSQEIINGYPIDITLSPYGEGLYKISAEYKSYHLDLVEVSK